MFNLISTALAHTAENEEINSFVAHHGFEMMDSFGFTGIFFGWTVVILFWALVILAIIALVKYINRGGYGSGIDKSTSAMNTTKDSEKIYVCHECGYEYKEKEWAIKCQKWCGEHKSCNINIIKYGTPSKN